MQDAPKPISFTKLPITTLRESIVYDTENTSDTIQQVPTINIFRPVDISRRVLQGTVSACLEPFRLTLRGVDRVSSCLICICHAPYDDITLPVDAESAPVWLSATNFEGFGTDNHSVCLLPADERPLSSYNEIMKDFLEKTCHKEDISGMDLLDYLLAERFHVLILDFTRKQTPGADYFTNANVFRKNLRDDIHFLSLFKAA